MFGVNVGAGANQLLKCKTITIAAPGEYSSPNADIVGMLEAVDRTPPASASVASWSATGEPGLVRSHTPTGGLVGGLQARLTVVRDDVAEAFGVPTGTAYGFDFTSGRPGSLALLSRHLHRPHRRRRVGGDPHVPPDGHLSERVASDGSSGPSVASNGSVPHRRRGHR